MGTCYLKDALGMWQGHPSRGIELRCAWLAKRVTCAVARLNNITRSVMSSHFWQIDYYLILRRSLRRLAKRVCCEVARLDNHISRSVTSSHFFYKSIVILFSEVWGESITYLVTPCHCITIVFPKTVPLHPGGRLNKKDGLTRYGNSHVKDKTS